MTSPLIITEAQNEITHEIDTVGPTGIVRLLRQCDMQIFSGWRCYESINDVGFIKKLDSLLVSLRKWFLRPLESCGDSSSKVKVILSGAGTSGRLAFLCSRALEEQSKKYHSNVTFTYLIAGGDAALIKGEEQAEDDVRKAVTDLKNEVDDDILHVIYIGITCGLSAPYVGAQIHYILETEKTEKEKFTSILIGFNEVQSARKTTVENWDKTLYEVVSRFSEISDGRHFLLNPVCGPEPITGSSRMKGGTVTKILIDSIFGILFHECYGAEIEKLGHDVSFPALFALYEITNRYTYLPEDDIAKVIQLAASALSNSGHIYYIGENSIGIIGLIDASECPPTYGAKHTDVKGIVFGGWETLRNKKGNISNIGDFFRISENDFMKDVPNLTEKDVLIVLRGHPGDPFDHKVSTLLHAATTGAVTPPRIVTISWIYRGRKLSETGIHEKGIHEKGIHEKGIHEKGIHEKGIHEKGIHENIPTPTLSLTVELPFLEIIPEFSNFLEISVKWVLNTISTGAHVLVGKVLGNVMIDLRVSNNKLFFRSSGLLVKLTKVSVEEATLCLIRSIYLVDEVTEDIRKLPISMHVEKALKREKVVPLAVLLATRKFSSVHLAQKTLEKEPIVSKIVQNML